MSLNFKKDGTLDMRYRSSKEYVAKYSSSSDNDPVLKKDGTPDMRFNSSKAYIANGGSMFSSGDDNYSSSVGYNPVFKKDGTLDMRYRSSKDYIADGGSIYGPERDYYPFSTANTYNYKKDGTLDMRYRNSKNYVANGGSKWGPRANFHTSIYSEDPNLYKNDDTLNTHFNSSSEYTVNEGSVWGPNVVNSYSCFIPPSAIPSKGPSPFEVNPNPQPDYSSSFYTEYDIKLNYDGTINQNSRAVRNGEILFNIDGTIDKRCSAFKHHKILLNSDGQIDWEGMNLDFKKAYEPVFKNGLDLGSSLYTDKDIKINLDGSINLNSSAVRKGEILFNNDGTIDKRCIAVRQNKIMLDSTGNVDFVNMNLKCNNLMDLNSRSTLYTNKDIKLNRDGTINRLSRAVRKGEIFFKSDGSIDRRCEAVQKNKVLLDSHDQIDYKTMNLELPKKRSKKTEKSKSNENHDYSFEDLNLLPQQDPFSSIGQCTDVYGQNDSFTKPTQNINQNDNFSQALFEPESYTFQPQNEIQPNQYQNNIEYQERGIDINDHDDTNYYNDENYREYDRNYNRDDREYDYDTDNDENDNYKYDQISIEKQTSKNINDEKAKPTDNEEIYEPLQPKMYKYQRRVLQSQHNSKPINEDEKIDQKPTIRRASALKAPTKSIKRYRKTSNTTISRYFILIFAFLFLYFFTLSFIPIPNENNYMNSCPKQAVCNAQTIGNRTYVKIQHCNDKFVKIENGFIQICSPNSQSKLDVYKDTLKAATYISEQDGNCFFKHDKLSKDNIVNLFPKVDLDLLQNDGDFKAELVVNEFRSTSPQYNSFCRAYVNSVEIMPSQTVFVLFLTILALFLAKKYVSY